MKVAHMGGKACVREGTLRAKEENERKYLSPDVSVLLLTIHIQILGFKIIFSMIFKTTKKTKNLEQ